MKILFLALLLYLFLVETEESKEKCEIHFKDNDVCACSSQDQSGMVKCQNISRNIEIQPCYCMYYDAVLNRSVLGHCYFSCHQLQHQFIEITTSVDFNRDFCSEYGFPNRKGRFCGQCNSSLYGLAAYSYPLIDCTPCQSYGYKNWLKYFSIALFPLTVFYTLALLLSFNVTSSRLNGVIVVIQCITSPVQMIMLKTNPYLKSHNTWISIILKAAISVVSMTNLDFFRFVYPSFCLHPKANVLEMMSLDYLIALYPFLLIVVTYLLVSAYDKQYRLVVWIWKVLKCCIYRYQRTRRIQTSLIEIFATFILLSYVKILDVSFQMLSYTNTYSIRGVPLKSYYLSSDATIKYFGSTHLPFALLAMVMAFIFNIIPLLLLSIYPCHCFHRCLNACRLRSNALHIFMDAFQGSYRTETYDLRYFSSFYLILRILILAQNLIFPSTLKLFTSGILSISAAAIIALLQPYKVKAHNTMDIILMIIMGVYFITYYEVLVLTALGYGHQWVVAAAINFVSFILLLFLLIALIGWLFAGPLILTMLKKVKAVWRKQSQASSSHGDVIESLIDRENSDQEVGNYKSLGSSQLSTY